MRARAGGGGERREAQRREIVTKPQFHKLNAILCSLMGGSNPATISAVAVALGTIEYPREEVIVISPTMH